MTVYFLPNYFILIPQRSIRYEVNRMKTEKNKNDFDKDPYRVEATSDFPACSSMDCTGLIPSLPQSEAELESYEELYPYITHAVKDEDTHVE